MLLRRRPAQRLNLSRLAMHIKRACLSRHGLAVFASNRMCGVSVESAGVGIEGCFGLTQRGQDLAVELRCSGPRRSSSLRNARTDHRDVHALAAEVIDHREAFDAPAVGKCFPHEVCAPGVIDVLSGCQGLALASGAFDLGALAHRQVGQLVQAPHAFVVHLVAFKAQQVLDAPVAKALALVRQLDDARA